MILTVSGDIQIMQSIHENKIRSSVVKVKLVSSYELKRRKRYLIRRDDKEQIHPEQWEEKEKTERKGEKE